MHHLHVNGRQSFERIASIVDTMARKAAIFEYVDPKDGNMDLINHGRPIDYDLTTVTDALSRHFAVSAFSSDRPTRKLLLCEKSG